MATNRQREAARRNIKKAQSAWENMSPRERSIRQREGKGKSARSERGQ